MADKSINLQAFYPECLKVTNISETEHNIVISLKSTKHSHTCPSCGHEMRTYHGTYTRTVQDLSILQKNVSLLVNAYEYYCDNDECDTTTFVEDYEGFICKSGRMTSRLEDFIQTLAFETSCEGAALICKKLGIQISGDTIIRMLRKLVSNPVPICGDTIGVDEFAYRKRRTYCTIICDAATHKPIDVLDGRDGIALKEWLRNNKQIKKVTRDRAGTYAKAISDELPDTMQIADRFHLHQNLLNAIKEALKRELPNKIAIPESFSAGPDEPDSNKKNRAR